MGLEIDGYSSFELAPQPLFVVVTSSVFLRLAFDEVDDVGAFGICGWLFMRFNGAGEMVVWPAVERAKSECTSIMLSDGMARSFGGGRWLCLPPWPFSGGDPCS